MIVRHLSLAHFRNYAALTWTSPGINVIYGDNAQGKTNLIEAIAYLSACRSHRRQGRPGAHRPGRRRGPDHSGSALPEPGLPAEIQLRRGQRRRLKKTAWC